MMEYEFTRECLAVVVARINTLAMVVGDTRNLFASVREALVVIGDFREDSNPRQFINLEAKLGFSGRCVPCIKRPRPADPLVPRVIDGRRAPGGATALQHQRSRGPRSRLLRRRLDRPLIHRVRSEAASSQPERARLP